VLTTDQKGNVAELAIAAAAAGFGIDVYRPVGEGGSADLVFGIAHRLLRVQCKWAPLLGETIVARCYSSRRNRDRFARRRYDEGEIDALAAYCRDTAKCYFLPPRLWVARREVRLRVGPCRNNQQLRINWASDYEFAATLGAPGAIAQLGERLHGMQEVAGSSPAGSIID
jgi:PD-(D/E)XK endonuclease